MKRNPEYRPITTAARPTNQDNQFTKANIATTNSLRVVSSGTIPDDIPASLGSSMYPTVEQGGKPLPSSILYVHFVCPNANTGINKNTKTNKTRIFLNIPGS